MVMLVRNTVEDYGRWRRVFDAQAAAGRSAGLNVLQMWRSVDDPNEVYFLLDVEDRARAEAFMQTPESAAVGTEAGVIEAVQATFVFSRPRPRRDWPLRIRSLHPRSRLSATGGCTIATSSTPGATATGCGSTSIGGGPHLNNVASPGAILREEFLRPLDMTQKKLAYHLGWDVKAPPVRCADNYFLLKSS